mgnify:CR=1 FL=1
MSKKYVSDIWEVLGCDLSKKVVLDQPFSGTNPLLSFRFFENPKAIIVDRDPRDLYIFTKEFLNYRTAGYQIPSDDVYGFIEYYKALRNSELREKSSNTQDVLRISFEDLVYRYDDTTEKISHFCCLEGLKRNKTIFDPSLSINKIRTIFRGCKDNWRGIKRLLVWFL